jgi:hypothetical protein
VAAVKRLFSHIPHRLKPKLRLQPIQGISERFSAADNVGLSLLRQVACPSESGPFAKGAPERLLLVLHEDSEHWPIS